ncbi:MAG: energy-coupling factor ABC transporter permease [Planctomycetota bacterium]|nr:energy-coupling factor ABC transporter permease [Planctomycetota bacterium]
MHVPDGLFADGTVHAATGAVSAAAVGLAAWRAKKTLQDRHAPLLGVSAAFVFAAQMLNFPVAAGVSGHFLGAVLTAVLLGPAGAMLVLAVVLAIQCLLFADGGLTALGTNLFNMGLVGAVGGYVVFRALQIVLPRARWSFLAATAVAAWASVVASSGACAVELAVSGTIPLRVGLPALAGIHALIGIGEAVVTTAALSLVLAGRPDIITGWRGSCPSVKGAPA